MLGVWWADNGCYNYPNQTLYENLPRYGLWEIQEGASELVRRLAEDLEENMVLGARVTEISDTEYQSRVVITYDRTGVQKTEEFEYAIITVQSLYFWLFII